MEKVLFRYQSDILDEIVVETMWSIVVNRQKGLYKLDSIPFWGPLIATDDEFYAEYDEFEERLTYRETTKDSGNSVVTVIIVKDGYDKEILRVEFRKLNCQSNGLNDSYFSMEIPAGINYREIKARLDLYEEKELISYSEPCLSSKHSKEISHQ